jgi:hypothetical protein
MSRSFLYSLPLFAAFAQIASAHDSLMPHQHPHGASALLGTNFLIVTALTGLAVILAAKPVRKAMIRVLHRRRK